MKYLIAWLVYSFSSVVLACPNCAGSAGKPGDQYLVYILGSFILLIYIPFYILFKSAYKKRLRVKDNA
ncbi:MAG: hypothetical protein JNM93_10740 [Bacteriovoracaceae bacterium]|nr:hypothetical protein [Bacteriovoracaceae bacterium]